MWNDKSRDRMIEICVVTESWRWKRRNMELMSNGVYSHVPEKMMNGGVFSLTFRKEGWESNLSNRRVHSTLVVFHVMDSKVLLYF